MISVAVQIWLMLIFIALGKVSPQFPVPYPVVYPGIVHMVPGPPQPIPVPVPMPVPVGIPIPVKERTTTTTTTCKPEKVEDSESPSIRIYIPWPPYLPPIFPNISGFPFNNQNFTLKLPPQMPYHLVPPAFPMPIAMPAPPPLVMIPIPPMIKINPHNKHHKKEESSSSDSSSTDDSDDSESSESSDSISEKKHRKRKKYGIYRSNRRLANHDSSEEEIKPILTYQSQNGDIKLSKRLSKKEAQSLMHNARKSGSNLQIIAGKDSIGKPRVMIVAKSGQAPIINRRAKVERQDVMVGDRKELVFKVKDNKTISNLTVSFNVNR